jgi:hypothetical protein
MKKLVLGFIFLVVQQYAWGHSTQVRCDGFLEKNNLRIPIGQKFAGDVTQEQFNEAIEKVVRVYSPIFTQKRQRLVMKKLWENTQVNAVAYQESGNAVVEIWGGLGRHATMTPDAVTLVTCHEVGHHLGGTPKYSDQNGAWAAVEGQADYFATLKCLRKVFRPEVNSWNGEVAPTARAKCNESHGADTVESKICQRIAMAGIASARLSASLGNSGQPSFDARDSSVVQRTFERHPQAQCRLDTYMNGNVCRVNDSVDVNDRDPNVGVCRNTTEEQYGARSLCWYKPSGSGTNPTPPNPQPPTPQPPTPQPPNPQPPTPQPPVSDVAQTPRLNGQESLVSRNPNAIFTLTWDVSNISGATGIYFEVIGPNKEFQEEHGVQPDPQAMPGGSFARQRGQIRISPARQLPGWGTYRFRVIPLDRSGRQPAGRFSSPAVFELKQN